MPAEPLIVTRRAPNTPMLRRPPRELTQLPETVEMLRATEVMPEALAESRGEPIAPDMRFAKVPDHVRERLRALLERLACVAYYDTAPREYLELAEQWLSREPGGRHNTRWQRSLVDLFTVAHEGRPALLLWKTDGTPRNAVEVVRLICFNVVNRAMSAPAVVLKLASFHKLDDVTKACLARAAQTIERQQRDQIQVPTRRGGGGKRSPQRAASDFAKALGLDLEGKASRVRRKKKPKRLPSTRKSRTAPSKRGRPAPTGR